MGYAPAVLLPMASSLSVQDWDVYDFTLIAEGRPQLTDTILNALFEAGCDDATPSIRRGLLHLDFSRAAPSLEHAASSAIRDTKRAGVDARLL